jgi:rubrerythrin
MADRGTKPRERTCPSCNELVRPVPIVYGMPTQETYEEAQAGKLSLGGCVLTGDDPEWACPRCDAAIFDDEEQRQRYERALGPSEPR